MKGIEEAIRRALARTGAADADARQRVYRSARAALEKSLRRQDADGSDRIAAERQRLETVIAAIEAEHRWGTPPVPDAAGQEDGHEPVFSDALLAGPPRSRRQRADGGGPRSGPSIRLVSDNPIDDGNRPRPVPDMRPEPAVAPLPTAAQAAPVRAPDIVPDGAPESASDSALRTAPDDYGEDGYDALADDALDVRPGEVRAGASAAGQGEPSAADLSPADERAVAPARRRPRWFALTLVAALVIAFGGIGWWWAQSTGLFMTAAQRDTSVPNPPASVREEDFAGNGTASGPVAGTGSAPARWITVMQGEDTGTLAAADAVSVVAGEGTVRITSADAGPGGEVRLEMPADLLEAMAGTTSTILIEASAAGEEPTEIYVACAFAEMGPCGRRRFVVDTEITDIVFNVDFTAAPPPGGAGALILNSDISAAGRPIDLHAVRVQPGS